MPVLRISQWLGGGVRYVLLMLLACSLSMGISFGLVRHFTRGLSVTESLDRRTLLQARLLRSYANELVDLTEDYLARIPFDVKAPKPQDLQWVRRDFQPRIEDLEERMNAELRPDAPAAINIAPFRGLRSAADRAMAMAGHPADPDLRRSAARDIVHAVESAEEAITQMKAASHLDEPPRPMRYLLRGSPAPPPAASVNPPRVRSGADPG
jgi:hypothetical protein